MRDVLKVLQFLVRLSREIRMSKAKIAFIIVAGIVSGLASTAMIYVLIKAIVEQGDAVPSLYLWGFVAMVIALPAFRLASQMVLINVTQKSFLDLRMRLTRRVLDAPLRHLESVGQHRLLATLTGDIATIVDALLFLPGLIMHSAIVLSSMIYLGYLSPIVLAEITAFIIVGIVTYQLPVVQANKYFTRARTYFDDMSKHIRALTEGTKELKMHRGRREGFVDSFERSNIALQGEMRTGSYIFAAASSWGQVLFFVVIGLLILVVPRFQPMTSEQLMGFTIILFQMMAPLEVLLGAFPLLSRAGVAVNKVEELGFSLADDKREREIEATEPPPADWQSLELVGVTHSYRREREEETFQLGPIDLAFKPGELVFIVGGNGSGKTTLAKLILALYSPEAGEIRVDGKPVTDADRVRYRERFTAVFSDFFVFETLFGLDAASLDEDAKKILVDLHLDHKVKVESGQLSTIELSQGQKKRLALLAAYLEDRPIYLFDEWAADQDPYFKEIFYLQLLPELKRRGKTVFVISHDDRYFHVADRILKLEYGKIELDRSMTEFLEMAPGSLFGTGKLEAQPAHV